MKKLKEIKREAIIQAAKDEFRANGFGATSMDQIAKTAQVSKRTVYNHFESKEVLFAAISLELCHIFSHVSDHPYDPDTPVRTQVEAIAWKLMNFLSDDRFLRAFKLMLTETLNSPNLTKSIIDNFQESDIGVIKWITEAAEDGKLDVISPVMAGKQLMAMLEAFTTWPYLYGVDQFGEGFDQQAIVQSTVNMFLDHYEVRSS